MLTFLTGTYFPSKKEYIYGSIRKKLEDGKRVYLIVPEQSSFERDRDFLFTYGERLGNLLTVSSFTHLASDVLEENGFRAKPQADESARNVIMSLAVEECADELNIYSKFSSKGNSVARLLGEYSEICSAGLSSKDLFSVSSRLPDGTLKNKTKELALIFSAYEALLSERFSDASGNISRMTEFLAENRVFDGAHIYFDDFRGFTGAQIRLLEEIIAQAEDICVSVFAPDSVHTMDSGAFAHAVSNCRRLRAAAEKRGVRCCEKKTDSVHPVAPLEAVNSSLFCGEKEIYDIKTDSVTVCRAADKPAECDFVALQIKKLLESGLRCRDISVSERSGKYMSSLTASLKKYGIPVFEDKRVPLSEYPLVRMLISAVGIAVYGFSSDEVFSYLKTGITGISDEECSELESYAFIWQTERGAWTKPFTGHPGGFGEKEDDDSRKRLARLEDIRLRTVNPLLRLKRRLMSADGSALCTAVFEFLVETDAAENFRKYAEELYRSSNEAAAIECSRVWDFVMQAIDALNEIICRRNVSPQRFSELLKIILSSGDIGRIPAGIDEIVIGTAGRTRHLEPEAVFVLGCNEGVFPQPPVSSGLFTPAEKRLLGNNDFSLEGIPENVYAEERMIAYSVLNNAKSRLFISYCESDSAGNRCEPSEIVREIREMLPLADFCDTASLTPLDKIGSRESAFEQCAIHFSDNTVFSESLKKYVEETDSADRMEAVRNISEKKPAVIKDKELATGLFGKDMYISPSRADVFYTCAFRYFCQHGMRISKPAVAELDARINGILIHHLLEKILLGYSNKTLAAMDNGELRRIIDEITEEFISDYMGGREDKGILLNRSLDKAKENAFAILQRMKAEFAESLFETVDVELDISYDGEIAPCKIRLSDGGSITVGGKVDRVDAMKDGEKTYIRVVDYKTGGKEFKLSDVYDGLNMQMLIYLMCIWDNGKDRYGNVIPAGILYLPARNSGKMLPRNAGSEEVFEQKLRNGRMNGMILEDRTVLEGMEKDCRGRFLNASVDSKGNMKGCFLSLNGFRLLHKKIDEMLGNMGEALHNGEIGALPVTENENKAPCIYCDYKDICRRSEGDPSRTPSGFRHERAVEMLKGSEDDG